MATKVERELARKFGISVPKLRALMPYFNAMPMQVFLDRLFGPGQAVYDPHENLWIVRDPKHQGPGFGFIAVRPDNSFFTGVVPAAKLQ